MKKIFFIFILLHITLYANNLQKVFGWNTMKWVFQTQKSYENFKRNKVASKAPLAGLHIDKKGNFYVSVPRWMHKDVPSTLNKIVYIEGKPFLEPFPSAWMNNLDNPNGLRNVLGFTIDTKQRMWILDKGDIASEKYTPLNAQKIIIYDLIKHKVIKIFIINDALADRTKSFLNDITVDSTRDFAYISDSGIKSAPQNETGIIVYDLKNNTAKRVLNRDISTKNNPKYKLIANGEEVFKNHPFQVGINGIALSQNADTLYWSKTTGRHFYSINTAILREFSTTDSRISSQVQDLGTFGGSSDGIVVGTNGIVYITDLTNNRIVAYNPSNKIFSTLIQDKRLIWPDTLSFYNGMIYFTVNRLHKAFAQTLDYTKNNDKFEIWRIQIKK